MNSTNAIIATLESAPSILLLLIQEVPPALLRRRPEPDSWSVHEHACHLALTQSLFSSRLDLMLRETHPVIKPYSPDAGEEIGALQKMDLNETLERFAKDRQALVERLKTLSPGDWERTGQHPEYSHYSIFIMFRHMALHDMDHAYSIEELRFKKDWA